MIVWHKLMLSSCVRHLCIRKRLLVIALMFITLYALTYHHKIIHGTCTHKCVDHYWNWSHLDENWSSYSQFVKNILNRYIELPVINISITIYLYMNWYLIQKKWNGCLLLTIAKVKLIRCCHYWRRY